jgi:hypothetical protein
MVNNYFCDFTLFYLYKIHNKRNISTTTKERDRVIVRQRDKEAERQRDKQVERQRQINRKRKIEKNRQRNEMYRLEVIFV